MLAEVLAAVGGGGTIVGLAAVVVLAFKLVSAKDDVIAARDLLDGERETLRSVRTDLNNEIVAHANTSKMLEQEHNLRLIVERQRNEAAAAAREYLVKRIKESNVVDANKLIADLLAVDLRSGVLAPVPKTGSASPGSDDLERP